MTSGVPTIHNIDEQTALADCREGSRMAQKYFYDKYVDSMMLLSIRYVKNHEDAKEACMDGFYNFFKNTEKFEWQGEGSINAWLKKIVVNQCLMLLRKKKDFIIASDDMERYEGVSVDISALDTMAAKEIINLIQQLPTGYRTVFNLYVLEGKAHKEIAALLQISENTSKSQLHKAKAMLKEKNKIDALNIIVMEREFEKLGNQLDNADLGDIMPSFDKQEEWAGLQEKLEQRDKKRIVPIWFRYAAAVVVGLLLGGVSVKQFMTGGVNTEPQVVVDHSFSASQQTITINQPKESSVIVIEKQEPKSAITKIKETKTKIPIAKKVQEVEEEKLLVSDEKVKKIEELPTTKKKLEKKIIAKIQEPLRRRAIHFLDIDNEDREVVLSNPQSFSSTYQHMMRQVAHTHTMSSSATNQPVLLRKMFKK